MRYLILVSTLLLLAGCSNDDGKVFPVQLSYRVEYANVKTLPAGNTVGERLENPMITIVYVDSTGNTERHTSFRQNESVWLYLMNSNEAVYEKACVSVAVWDGYESTVRVAILEEGVTRFGPVEGQDVTVCTQ